MTHPIIHIDISNNPDLMRLAEEVRESKEPRMLVSDHEAVAILLPADAALKKKKRERRGPKGKTKADYEAFRAAAGGWKDVDTDTLIKNIYEDRRRSNRPPVEL